MIDFVIIGGFLGAGKTTLITRLARVLREQGRRAGIVTNDQAGGLVDTRLASLTQLPVAEVAGGCFCCRFDDLLDQIETVVQQGVDVILAEPVGSCTDLVATVYEPLRRNYPGRWHLAPFAVVVDPLRAGRYVAHRDAAEEDAMAFLFRKQLEEAELIILNKVDTLAPVEQEHWLRWLESEFDASAVLPVSARSGEGLQELLEALGRPAGDLSHRILAIDYQRYAAAEAALGWLNASITLKGEREFDADRFLARWLEAVREATVQNGGEIAHFKLWAASNGQGFRVSLTGVSHPLTWDGSFGRPLRSLSITVNARVAVLPVDLERIVCRTAKELASRQGIECRIEELACFQPAEPRPTHRVPANPS